MALKKEGELPAGHTSPRGGTNEGTPIMVPLWKINILPQMRTVFDEAAIIELAKEIDIDGVLQNPGIACLTVGQCEDYIEVFNQVKGTKTKVADLTSVMIRRKPYYYILIFGERRIRALRWIWNFGDPKANVHLPNNNGRYLRKRFRTELVNVTDFNGLNAFEALGKQIRENNYVKPSPEEAAVAATELFNFRRIVAGSQGQRLTLAEFAREQGASEDKLRKQIQWTQHLPLDIQEAVRQKRISYGMSQELIRVLLWAERHIGELVEREQFFGAAVEESIVCTSKQTTLGSFSKWVSDHITIRAKDIVDNADEQFDLSDLMDASQHENDRRVQRKNELSSSTELNLRNMCSSVRTWKHFIETGRLKAIESPLLAGSVRRQIELLAELLTDLVEHGEFLLKPHVYAQIKSEANELPELMLKLDALYPDPTCPAETIKVAIG